MKKCIVSKNKVLSVILSFALLVSVTGVPVMAENDIDDGFVAIEDIEHGASEIGANDPDIQIAAAFTQRTSAPNRNSDYWYKSGVNPLVGIYSNGNCTWYAWGRASEIQGSALPAVTMTRTTNVNNGNSRVSFRGNAWSWWYDNQELNSKGAGYSSGQTPAVGAIAVWGTCSTSSAGHVAIVEAINGDNVTISESSYGGVWYTGSYWGSKTYTSSQLKTAITNNKVVMPFLGYIYINGSGTSVSVHTHNWQTGYESTHPHKQYRSCAGCGAKEYTGKTQLVSSCSSCYPVGNVKLTRSADKIGKTAVFHRNNVSNANSYSLALYRNGTLYNTYNMSNASKSVSGLLSGNYYAVLTARNSNTGQSRQYRCDSFTIVDTYQVTYNANGGSNAPSSQLKIQNENLTLTASKPVRAHYIFKGWASSKTAIEPQYNTGAVYMKNTPITLYAVWEPETYTISFDMNGGMGSVEPTVITYGDSMRMPNSVVKESYYLKGWAKNNNSSNPDYRIGMDYALDENMTLYAVWGNSTWGGAVSSGFAGGSGTESDPYQISNAGELAYLAKTVNEQASVPEYKYYVLTDNINLGFREWRPIGLAYSDAQCFYGSFDGNGYTISDLSISEGNEGSIGLFGKAKNSEIKNLNINGDISGMTLSNTAYIGAVVGNADNSDISGCNALYVNISDISNTSAKYSYMGAICGYANGKISGCSADNSSIAMKDGYLYSGIIAGYLKGSVEDCEVTSSSRLFGSSTETDNLYLGGICGYLDGNAEKCIVKAGHYSNTLKAKQSYIGGIAGYSTGTLNLCTAQFDNGSTKSIDGISYPSSIYAEGSNTSRIGGITGLIAKGGKVTNCKYDGQSISSVNSAGTADVGGIAGQVYGNQTTKITAQGGQSLSRSSLPTRGGYKATWYTDSNQTKEYDFSQPVTGDMTLYARWTEGEDKIEIWDGTSEEPAYNADTKTYTVTNGKELAWISDVTNGIITSGTSFPESTSFEGYTIELANDIYLNDISNVANWETTAPANEWKPIGKNDQYVFEGIILGHNKTIYGIYYNDTNNNGGLVGTLATNGTIKNIIMVSGFIKSKHAGGVVGNAVGINNVTMSSIENCINYVNVSTTNGTAGGIVGYLAYFNVQNCINKGSIKETDGGNIGGIAGHVLGKTIISHCINNGTIEGNTGNAGGITGYASGTTLTHPDISHCTNSGIVQKGTSTGGIVGSVDYGNINYSYNIGRISGMSGNSVYTGGIIGKCEGWGVHCSMMACHNMGDITGGTYVGGIAGDTEFTSSGSISIKMCYNVGNVSGGSYVGGLTGYIAGHAGFYASVTNSYAIQASAGKSGNYVSTSSIGQKTTTQMKTLSNLTGFSTTDWAVDPSINDGYPYLKSLEDTYKTYNITAIEDSENAALLNKCFVNVDGVVYSQSTSRAAAGGAVGYAGLSSQVNSAPANNLLIKADRVSAKTSGSGYKAQAGKVIGLHNYNALDFNNITSFDEMEVSAVNSANSGNIEINSTTGSEKQLAQMTQARTLTQIFGPNTYQSLADLEEHPDAVWVVKSGSLPDLYYNLLRDITISDTENGTIEVDKTQAVDDEIVTVTATPDEGYRLNKIYVNGNEITGSTFAVSGDSDVYATFKEKTPEYKISVTDDKNASATLVNVDRELSAAGDLTIAADNKSLTAVDGEEIRVNTSSGEEYTVDSVYVNGEELASESFIVTADSNVTLKVASLSTETKAETYDAEDIGNYFATLSGKVEGDDSEMSRYIRYWAEDDPETVYMTEPENGSGDYTVEVTNLIPETEYQYQMCDSGEVKSFSTGGYYYPSGDDGDSGESGEPITETAYEINNISVSENEVSVDVTKLSDVSGIVIAAAYDSDGVLIDAKYKQISSDDEDFTVIMEIDTSKAAKIKVMIWDSLDSGTPLAVPWEWSE